MITQISRLALIAAISLGFILKATPVAARRTVTCQSQNFRYQFCRVNTSGGVTLNKQLGNVSCRQGRNWGYDRDGIWVDDGCSAEFIVRGRESGNDNDDDTAAAIIGGALAVGVLAAILADSDDDDDNNRNSSSRRTITCSSENRRYHKCRVNLRSRRVKLKRQLSRAGCWEGDTWGYDREGIWVDNGCSGVFKIKERRN